MGTISDKLTYLNTTKSQLKDMINYGLDDNNKITSSTTFRNYVSSIFNAFLEALRTPDTLFTNLPKKSGTGSNITLNDTANAPMRIELGASELTQDGTPTPSSPEDIHTISGSNKVVVCGKNLFDEEYYNNDNLYSINVYKYTKLNIKGNRKIYGCAYLKEGKTSISGLYLCLCSEVQPNVSGAVTKWLVSNGSISSMSYGDFTGHNDIYLSWYPTSITPAQIFETYNIMVSLSDTLYTPYVSQEADIDLTNPNNLIGLTTERCPVDLKAGDKITVGNLTSTQVVFNCYTNRGDTTRNDYWTIQTSQRVRTITIGYDTKEIAWTTTPDNIIWINKGETLLPYSPYYNYNYCKIGNYEDKFIRNSGKNLLDTTNWTGAYITSNGSITTDNDKINALFDGYIKVEPNTSYTFSANKTLSNMAISEYDSSKTFIQRNSQYNISSKTITTTANTEYVRIGFNYDSATTITQTIINNLELMLNKGNQALPYEPYGTNEWYYKQAIDKYVANNDLLSNGGGTLFVDLITPALNITPSLNTPETFSGYTLNNLMNEWSSGGGESGLGGTTSAGNIRVRLTKDYCSDTATARTFLTDNNFTIYYVMATPTYTQITGTLAEQLENVYQKMISYSGQTSISQINADLPFTMSVQAIEK